MFNKFLYFFNKYQKRSLLALFSFMLIATTLEMLGLGFIFSIVGTLDSANAKSILFIDKLSAFLGLDKDEIISYLLIAFIGFYVIKIIFLTFYNWFESNFLFSYNFISKRLDEKN